MRKMLFFLLLFFASLMLGSTLASAQGEARSKCGRSQLCGTIEAMAVERYDEVEDEIKLVETRYSIRIGDRSYGLDGETKDLANAIGKTVIVQGRVRGNRIYVEKHDFELPPSEIRALPPGEHDINFSTLEPNDPNINFGFGSTPRPTAGDYSVAVQMAQVIGQQPHNTTPEQLTQAYFSTGPGSFSAKDFLLKASGNMFRIDGSVLPGVVMVNGVAANCDPDMFNGWKDQVNLANANNSTWQAANTRVIYYPAMDGCFSTAVGSVGIKGGPNNVQYVFLSRSYSSSITVENFLKGLSQTLAHELGHNVGIALHPGGLNPDGTIMDSDDRGDFMAGRFRNPNLYNRFVLGWVQGRVTAISGPRRNAAGEIIPYRFKLFPPDQNSRGLLNGRNGVVIQLFNADGSLSSKIMVIEVRRNYGYDTFGATHWYVTGVTVRICDADMTLNTARSLVWDYTPWSIFGFDDATIPQGATADLESQYGVRVTFDNRSLVLGSEISILISR